MFCTRCAVSCVIAFCCVMRFVLHYVFVRFCMGCFRFRSHVFLSRHAFLFLHSSLSSFLLRIFLPHHVFLFVCGHVFILCAVFVSRPAPLNFFTLHFVLHLLSNFVLHLSLFVHIRGFSPHVNFHVHATVTFLIIYLFTLSLCTPVPSRRAGVGLLKLAESNKRNVVVVAVSGCMRKFTSLQSKEL